MAALSELGLEDDTAVLFSTDHGDMTGAHGGFFDKGPFMYEETYHIPLVARVPGAGRPGVCSRFVSNMDLATTALDIAGTEIPERHEGRSLLPLIRDPAHEWPDDVMCEFHGHRYLYSQRMLRWDRYKYVFNVSECDELYDLEQDPHELRNCLGDPLYADRLRDGQRRLRMWMERTDDPLLPTAKMMIGG